MAKVVANGLLMQELDLKIKCDQCFIMTCIGPKNKAQRGGGNVHDVQI